MRGMQKLTTGVSRRSMRNRKRSPVRAMTPTRRPLPRRLLGANEHAFGYHEPGSAVRGDPAGWPPRGSLAMTDGGSLPAIMQAPKHAAGSANELTSFFIAKEPWRVRQSTGAIDQLVRHVAALLAMTIAKMVHCFHHRRARRSLRALAMTSIRENGDLPERQRTESRPDSFLWLGLQPRAKYSHQAPAKDTSTRLLGLRGGEPA
jgi:hypothetical protein